MNGCKDSTAEEQERLMNTDIGFSGRTTTEGSYVFTGHALTRMAQRNLTEADVVFAMRHGQRCHRDGIVFFFLGKRDLPKDAPSWSQRLEGTTVLLDPWALTIITVYRNRKALRHIKPRAKYNIQKARAPRGGASWAI